MAVVVKRPVGISVICPPFVKAIGGVIVVMAVLPDTNEIIVVGAIVVALAMVGMVIPDATGLDVVSPVALIIPTLIALAS